MEDVGIEERIESRFEIMIFDEEIINNRVPEFDLKERSQNNRAYRCSGYKKIKAPYDDGSIKSRFEILDIR